MNVSVIVTVYNERANIQRLLDSLADQSCRPDEVVICDGGSNDGTAEFVQTYSQEHANRLPNLRLIIEAGANISRGRNLAISAAHGPIIAATDAGVRLDRRWLEHLLAPWANAESLKAPIPHSALHTPYTPLASAGFFLPDVEGAFLTAMAATVLPLSNEIDAQKFLPSSRSVAFLKEAWQQIGGYPEWLDYCEDLIFDLKMNELAMGQVGQGDVAIRNSAFAWSPQALVYFRPRESLRSFWTQYYRYARGDGKADLWRKRHAIRYAIYLIAFPALVGHGSFGFFARWLGWVGLIVGVAFYCWRPWQRLQVLGKGLSLSEKLQAAILVPLIRVVGDGAKMVGYPIGLYWRWQNRQRAEIWWQKSGKVAK